jgi:hypothetical protein
MVVRWTAPNGTKSSARPIMRPVYGVVRRRWPHAIWAWIKVRREISALRCRYEVARASFESIRCDLDAQSYDAATIARRLTGIEHGEPPIALPSYVFTLLNRRAPLTQPKYQ